jgi:hypothetical protein
MRAPLVLPAALVLLDYVEADHFDLPSFVREYGVREGLSEARSSDRRAAGLSARAHPLFPLAMEVGRVLLPVQCRLIGRESQRALLRLAFGPTPVRAPNVLTGFAPADVAVQEGVNQP